MSRTKVFFGARAILSILKEEKGSLDLLDLAFERSINIATCAYAVRLVHESLSIASLGTIDEYPLRLNLGTLFKEHNSIFEFDKPLPRDIKKLKKADLPNPVIAYAASIKNGKPKAHYFASCDNVILKNHRKFFAQQVGIPALPPSLVYAAIIRQFKTS